MKKRYRWFCSLNKGCGKNKVVCGSVSRQHKYKKDAIRLAKVHESKCGHTTVYVDEQIYESKGSCKKKYWFSGKIEYAGSKKINLYDNVIYNYSWAKYSYMGYKFAVIFKNKIQPRSRLYLEDGDWCNIKIMSNKEIYNFCKSRYNRKYVILDGKSYSDMDELKQDMLIMTLSGLNAT